MFREAPLPDGKPGPVSMRRVLAAYFAALAAGMFLMALRSPAGWFVFIPGGICVLASMFLLFFTTWADVASVISAASKP